MSTKTIHNAGHIRVHSILYGNEPERIVQTVAHLDRAADLAIAAGALESVTLVYGDSSSTPVLDDAAIAAIAARSPALRSVQNVFFGRNMGSARGHNTLIEHAQASIDAGGLPVDAVLIMNPDVMLAPDALIELARPLQNPKAGMVEARQLPIEHPKEYSPGTGETGWATTACALIPFRLLRELGGFDADSFFLYCDDVDYSWRTRLAGYSVIYQPSAAVFHDKRLGAGGQWQPTSSEQYYSAEAALMMAHKYSRPEIVERLLKGFGQSDIAHLKRAADTFESRRQAGTLPAPIDKSHKVSVFRGDHYTEHRFSL